MSELPPATPALPLGGVNPEIEIVLPDEEDEEEDEEDEEDDEDPEGGDPEELDDEDEDEDEEEDEEPEPEPEPDEALEDEVASECELDGDDL